MTEHLSSEAIESYRRRQIDSASLREIDAHLASCERCIQSVLDSDHSSVAFDSLNQAFLSTEEETPFHLSQAELTNYLGKNVDEPDRIIFSSHLEDCQTCNAKLKQLADSARPVKASHASSEKAGASWMGQSWFTPARAAAALALIAVVAVAVIVWRRQQSDNHQLAGSNQPPSQTNTPSPAPTQPTPESVATTVALLKDNNREIKLERDGRLLGLESFDDASQRLAQAALNGEVPSKPDTLGTLASPKIKLLGGPEGTTFQIIGPVGRVVTDDRPVFRWRALAGADNYVVSVFDENFNGVAQSGLLKSTQWRSDARLKRGQTYSWEVKATRDNEQFQSPVPPTGAAKFAIVDGQQLAEIDRVKRQTPVSHLLLGIQYARAGLVNEAENEFRQLVKENPDSTIAKKLLRTVQQWK